MTSDLQRPSSVSVLHLPCASENLDAQEDGGPKSDTSHATASVLRILHLGGEQREGRDEQRSQASQDSHVHSVCDRPTCEGGIGIRVAVWLCDRRSRVRSKNPYQTLRLDEAHGSLVHTHWLGVYASPFCYPS